MARETNIPAKTALEEIRTLEEFPGHPGTPGHVRVVTGLVNARGEFLPGQQFQHYLIEGEHFEQLVSEGPVEWSADKPAGTYRNIDLWHFIDILRERAA